MSERPAFLYTQVLGAVGESGAEMAAHVQIQLDAQPALQLLATIGADAWLLLLTILLDSQTDQLGNIYCQASYEDLAGRLGWGRDRVSKTLRRLQGAKLVDRVQDKIPSHSGVRFSRQRIYVTYRESLVSFLSLPGSAATERLAPSSQLSPGTEIPGSEDARVVGHGNATGETVAPNVSPDSSSQFSLGTGIVAPEPSRLRGDHPVPGQEPGTETATRSSPGVLSSHLNPGAEIPAAERAGGQHHDEMMNDIHLSDGDDRQAPGDGNPAERVALVSAALTTWGFTDVPAILREYQLNIIEAAVAHTLTQVEAGRVGNPGGLCRTILKSGRVPSPARRPAAVIRPRTDPLAREPVEDEVAQHDFTPDASGISCITCQMPARNRVHSRPAAVLDERAGVFGYRPDSQVPGARPSASA